MKILVTGALPKADDTIPKLEQLGHTVLFMQNEKEPLPCEYEWVEGTICNGLFLSHPIERFVNLRYIQLTSAGYDRVPMDYVKAHKIEIHNARGVYSIPMAEFAICGVLQLYKQAAFFRENQKEHQWNKHRGLLELNGKTVCIVGCGSVGTECAKRFVAFGCDVLGVDLFPYQSELYTEMRTLDKLSETLGRSDIVVLTLPLTEETKYLFNSERFAMMKHGSVLVNIARGAVVDTNALVNALREGLYGAVLDVFEKEPIGESELWDMDNVLISPHNSFVSECNNSRLIKIILDYLNQSSMPN